MLQSDFGCHLPPYSHRARTSLVGMVRNNYCFLSLYSIIFCRTFLRRVCFADPLNKDFKNVKISTSQNCLVTWNKVPLESLLASWGCKQDFPIPSSPKHGWFGIEYSEPLMPSWEVRTPSEELGHGRDAVGSAAPFGTVGPPWWMLSGR